MPDEERYQRGLRNRARLYGEAGAERLRRYEAANPDFARYLTENVFGDLYERKGMDPKARETVILSILCALGRDREFESHVRSALKVGMTKGEVQEILMVCAYYAGIPLTVVATDAAHRVFEEKGL